MRIVAALGGNALLHRGEPLDASVQIGHIREAVRGLATAAAGSELVITHGNGPQVGLLAVESAADPALSAPYPLDVLGAQTQGMIGYWLARELRRALPGREVVAVLTETVIARTERPGAGSSPPPSPAPSWNSPRSPGSSMTAAWSSPPAVAASRWTRTIGESRPWWTRT